MVSTFRNGLCNFTLGSTFRTIFVFLTRGFMLWYANGDIYSTNIFMECYFTLTHTLRKIQLHVMTNECFVFNHLNVYTKPKIVDVDVDNDDYDDGHTRRQLYNV